MAEYSETPEYADNLPQNGGETTQENNAFEQTSQGTGDASQDASKPRAGDKIHASKDEDDGTKLFVGGLSWGTNEDSLKKYFGTYGAVVDAVVKMEVDTYGSVPGKSRGFGFVKFSDPASVKSILEPREGGHTIDGKVVDCKLALPQRLSKEPKVKKLFVGGLPNEVTEEQLREYFQDFGTITEDKGTVTGITLPKDQNNQKRRGFAFILFEDEESVEKIVLQQFHNIGEHRVEVKKALPQHEHQARQMGYGRVGAGFGRGRGRGRGAWGGNQGYGYHGGYSSYGGGYHGGYDCYGPGGYPGYQGGYDYTQDYGYSGQYGGGYGGYDLYSDSWGLRNYSSTRGGRSRGQRRGKTAP